MTEQKLPRSTPAAEGISPGAIADIIDCINQKRMGVHSMMILRHGKVAAECWWLPCRKDLTHMLFSLTKSFASIAAGFAVQEGILSTEDRVAPFFAESLPCRPCEYMEKVRIKHLLTHTTGFDEDPQCFFSPNGWPALFLRTYLEHEPGAHFAYTDDGPNMLSAILQKRTGQTMEEYLTPRLFEPLGITGWHWAKNADGVSLGGDGLSLKTEDVAKFGQFLLNQGMWNGKQLLDKKWIQTAASHITDTPDTTGDWSKGYGYYFWRCVPDGAFRGDGAFGQFCIVLPRQDMVVVLTSGSNMGGELLDLLWNKLLPAVHDEPLPEDAKAQAGLDAVLSGLALPCPAGAETSPAARFSGIEYELSPNPLQLAHIRFDFGLNTAVSIRAGRKSCTMPVGYGEWLESKTFLRPDILHAANPHCGIAACAGAWQNDTYRLAVQFPAAAYCGLMEITFDRIPVLECRWNVSFAPNSVTRIFARPV